MKADIKYLYEQAMILADQRDDKCYQVLIYVYKVVGVNDWENSIRCHLLIMQ